MAIRYLLSSRPAQNHYAARDCGWGLGAVRCVGVCKLRLPGLKGNCVTCFQGTRDVLYAITLHDGIYRFWTYRRGVLRAVGLRAVSPR